MNNEKLKSLSEEEKAEIVKQVNTEVTSIADEEAKTGKTLKVPTADELVQRASVAIIQAKKDISMLLPKMSKKAIHRATMAYLDLPTGDIPVVLRTPEEKMLFSLGQRAIQSRFIIIQHHINLRIQEERLKKAEEEKAKQQSEVQNNGEKSTTTTEQEAQ